MQKIIMSVFFSTSLILQAADSMIEKELQNPPSYGADSVSLPAYDQVVQGGCFAPSVNPQQRIAFQHPVLAHREADEESVSTRNCLELLAGLCCIGCETTREGRRACVCDGSIYIDGIGYCRDGIGVCCYETMHCGSALVRCFSRALSNYCGKPLCCVAPGKNTEWYWGCVVCLCLTTGDRSYRHKRECCRAEGCCYSCECGPNVVLGPIHSEDVTTCLEIGCGKDALIGKQEPPVCFGIKCICTGCPLQVID